MVRKSSFEELRMRVDRALLENEEKLKKEAGSANVSFMRGYKLAMNEVAGWIEMATLKRERV